MSSSRWSTVICLHMSPILTGVTANMDSLREDERDVWERGPVEWEVCPHFANAAVVRRALTQSFELMGIDAPSVVSLK